ncbi:MAG: phosphoglucosamine mutase [Verrucomicrobiae bacterium]|nr:phosphoglucosamine mutase [Verrucomicrobiae bacterium]
MSRKYFGTDGIRGEYGGSVLTDAFAYRLGKAAGSWLQDRGQDAPIVIGRDTRASGKSLLNALAAGYRDAGVLEVLDLGVLPTPAVAVFTRNIRAAIGVMITASHNPAKDNGIKFFNKTGQKFSDAFEEEIESLLECTDSPDIIPVVDTVEVPDASAPYLDLLEPILTENSLKGMRIVVDSANGSTFRTTPSLLRNLGAELVLMGNTPDGSNINQGVGSQHPEGLSRLVVESRADLGIAHDGDGDRILVCDEKGAIIDGDVLLCLFGLNALKNNKLNQSTLVATVQSNLGLDRAIRNTGGRVVRTSVGDRHVLEEMRKSGFNVGGENSGHIIFSDINFTGDGLLAAIQLLSMMLEEGRPLSVLKNCMKLFPQKTGAIQVIEKRPLEDIPAIQDTIQILESEMGESGRVLLRYSGTEPKIRLLIEGENEDKVETWYRVLESRVISELG